MGKACLAAHAVMLLALFVGRLCFADVFFDIEVDEGYQSVSIELTKLVEQEQKSTVEEKRIQTLASQLLEMEDENQQRLIWQLKMIWKDQRDQLSQQFQAELEKFDQQLDRVNSEIADTEKKLVEKRAELQSVRNSSRSSLKGESFLSFLSACFRSLFAFCERLETSPKILKNETRIREQLDQLCIHYLHSIQVQKDLKDQREKMLKSKDDEMDKLFSKESEVTDVQYAQWQKRMAFTHQLILESKLREIESRLQTQRQSISKLEKAALVEELETLEKLTEKFPNARIYYDEAQKRIQITLLTYLCLSTKKLCRGAKMTDYLGLAASAAIRTVPFGEPAAHLVQAGVTGVKDYAIQKRAGTAYQTLSLSDLELVSKKVGIQLSVHFAPFMEKMDEKTLRSRAKETAKLVYHLVTSGEVLNYFKKEQLPLHEETISIYLIQKILNYFPDEKSFIKGKGKFTLDFHIPGLDSRVLDRTGGG